ncbi:Midasin [Manis pentadactyla]|nr:Midasin [Manis pentadactyla]
MSCFSFRNCSFSIPMVTCYSQLHHTHQFLVIGFRETQPNRANQLVVPLESECNMWIKRFFHPGVKEKAKLLF